MNEHESDKVYRICCNIYEILENNRILRGWWNII